MENQTPEVAIAAVPPTTLNHQQPQPPQSHSVNDHPYPTPYAPTTTAVKKSDSTSIDIEPVTNGGDLPSSATTANKMSPRPGTGDSVLSDLKNLAIALGLILRAMLCAFIPSSWYTSTKSIVGKKIVITGGGFGFGRLVAQKLAERGGQVIILDINQQNMDDTVNLINDSTDKLLGGKATAYHCDVSDRAAVYSVANKITSDAGPVDILIMNAGIVNGGSILNLSDEAIIRCFNINTLSHFWLIKAFLPSMMARNSGHIVSIDSVASYYGTYDLSDYCASKAASHRLQESVDFELRYSGYTGIKLTSIMPYFMNTGMFAGSKSKYVPILEPETVANAAVDAILTGKTAVFVPYYFHILRVLTYLVPYKAYFYVHQLLFGGDMMINFTGRGKPSPSKNEMSPSETVVNDSKNDQIIASQKSNGLLDSLLEDDAFTNLEKVKSEHALNNNKLIKAN